MNLSDLLAGVRRSRRPKPFSLQWQLLRALARVRTLEAEVRRLNEQLIGHSEKAADAVVAMAGVNPVFEQQKPVTDDPEPNVFSLDQRKKIEQEKRTNNRYKLADLLDCTYGEVLERERAGMFDSPEWNIHDPLWWDTIGRQVAEAKKQRERAS